MSLMPNNAARCGSFNGHLLLLLLLLRLLLLLLLCTVVGTTFSLRDLSVRPAAGALREDELAEEELIGPRSSTVTMVPFERTPSFLAVLPAPVLPEEAMGLHLLVLLLLLLIFV